MKKIVTLSLFSFLVLFLAGCGKQEPVPQKTEQGKPKAPTQETQKPAENKPAPVNTNAEQQVPAKQEGVVYKNEKYGFELTLPKGWEKYKTTNNTMGVTVELPTTDKTWKDSSASVGNAGVFTVSVETISDWQKKCKAKEDGPNFANCSDVSPVGIIGTKKLGMNSKYVFTITTGQDFPDDLKKFICGSLDCDSEKLSNTIITTISGGFKMN